MTGKYAAAFPIVLTNDKSSVDWEGLNKIELFTGMAMQGLLSNPEATKQYLGKSKQLATIAMQCANEAIEALAEAERAEFAIGDNNTQK